MSCVLLLTKYMFIYYDLVFWIGVKTFGTNAADATFYSV